MELKGKKVYGFDFHRQKPLLNYIVDFYCNELELVIELDGYSHQLEEVVIKDELKELELKNYGLTMLRFDDLEVMNDMPNVIRTIEQYIFEYKRRNSSNE